MGILIYLPTLLIEKLNLWMKTVRYVSLVDLATIDIVFLFSSEGLSMAILLDCNIFLSESRLA